jgi:hypothetical protein
MKIKKFLAGQLLILALVFPHAVSAEDFTFNAGVELSDIPQDITGIEIVCTALNGNINLGEGVQKERIPANGALNKTIQVKFNANSGKNPAEANTFRCGIKVVRQDGVALEPEVGNQPICVTQEALNNNSSVFCTIQGKPLVKSLTGAIPGPSAGNSSGGGKKVGEINTSSGKGTK